MSMLFERFNEVSDNWTNRTIGRDAHAYLLFLLDKSCLLIKASRICMSLLDPLKDFGIVNTYTRGSAALAFMYKQLGLTSRIGVK